MDVTYDISTDPQEQQYDDGYDPNAYQQFESQLAPYGAWEDVPVVRPRLGAVAVGGRLRLHAVRDRRQLDRQRVRLDLGQRLGLGLGAVPLRPLDGDAAATAGAGSRARPGARRGSTGAGAAATSAGRRWGRAASSSGRRAACARRGASPSPGSSARASPHFLPSRAVASVWHSTAPIHNVSNVSIRGTQVRFNAGPPSRLVAAATGHAICADAAADGSAARAAEPGDRAARRHAAAAAALDAGAQRCRHHPRAQRQLPATRTLGSQPYVSRPATTLQARPGTLIQSRPMPLQYRAPTQQPYRYAQPQAQVRYGAPAQQSYRATPQPYRYAAPAAVVSLRRACAVVSLRRACAVVSLRRACADLSSGADVPLRDAGAVVSRGAGDIITARRCSRAPSFHSSPAPAVHYSAPAPSFHSAAPSYGGGFHGGGGGGFHGGGRR